MIKKTKSSADNVQPDAVAQMAIQDLLHKTFGNVASEAEIDEHPTKHIKHPKKYVLLEDTRIGLPGGPMLLRRGAIVDYPPVIQALLKSDAKMRPVA